MYMVIHSPVAFMNFASGGGLAPSGKHATSADGLITTDGVDDR